MTHLCKEIWLCIICIICTLSCCLSTFPCRLKSFNSLYLICKIINDNNISHCLAVLIRYLVYIKPAVSTIRPAPYIYLIRIPTIFKFFISHFKKICKQNILTILFWNFQKIRRTFIDNPKFLIVIIYKNRRFDRIVNKLWYIFQLNFIFIYKKINSVKKQHPK